MNTDKKIERYIQLRDKITVAKRQFDDLIAVPKKEMDQLEVEMLESLQANGLQNYKGQSGTVSVVTRTSLKANDWDVFLEYVQDYDLWHLLTKAPNKTACVEVLEETGKLPPGLEMNSMLSAQFRKSK